jgi:tetratricopeptide (TPR) repeat protein
MQPAPVMAERAANPDALFRGGIAAYRQGDYAASAKSFTAALALLPDHAGARINLANALWSLGDDAAAAQQADLACAADPGAAEAWIITGAIRLDRGDAAGATAAYRQAVRLRPSLYTAQAGLAAALLAEGQNEAAAQAAAQALALAPDHTHALFTLATARLAMHQPEAALESLDRLIALAQDHARARHNRANALIDLGRLAEAKAELHASIALDPKLKEAWATLGYLLTIQADLPAAIAACDQAIALDLDFAAGQWNRGIALLLNGDFSGGFAAYEWRKRHPIFRHHFTQMPGTLWTGESLAGKHLLVRAEQGFGDTIMLARFLPQLAAQAARLTLCCPPCLFPLFRHMQIECYALNAPPPSPDFSVDQMSLPHILHITETTIPSAAGYLATDPDRCAALGRTLPPGRKIGLVWAGNPGHDNDRHRSLPPGALTPLLDLADCTFVSLQLGARRHEYPIHHAATLIRDYGDTAAILSQLDAVVTVDTSIAHLAGAMGIPCHVLLSAACDWRWRLGRNDTLWYTSLTLHRQHHLDDWFKPLASVTTALRETCTPPKNR